MKFCIEDSLARKYGSDAAHILVYMTEQMYKHRRHGVRIDGYLWFMFRIDDVIRAVPWIGYNRAYTVLRRIEQKGGLAKRHLSHDERHRVGWYTITDPVIIKTVLAEKEMKEELFAKDNA